MEKRQDGRVRKRTSNACVFCRRQKIRCSGSVPCQQCTRRRAQCIFDEKQSKVYVSQSYISELERRVAQISQSRNALDQSTITRDGTTGGSSSRHVANNVTNHLEALDIDLQEDQVHESDEDQMSESVCSNPHIERIAPDVGLENPLDPNNSHSFTVDTASRRFFLGVSSNWSFGRRVLTMLHEKVHGAPLPATSLLFEGSAYDIGWNGHRDSASIDISLVPTADFALFLINAVKFHCGRLFHMFEEPEFMHCFSKFYEDPSNENEYGRIWYIHFLLILAFGKAFIVGASKDKRPPGCELFAQAMKLFPDVTCLFWKPVQSIEILCCAALYLHCLDKRSAAYTLIGQAFRIALEQGMHTDMQSQHLRTEELERNRKVWWTVYILDRHMTALMGVPMSLSDDDVTTGLPSYAGSAKQALALGLHVKLSQTQAVILQTVYGKTSGRNARFLSSMKHALRTLADTNDERNKSFPLNLQMGGLDRFAAYLHLFHHQCLILATRPLLYSFLQRRLSSFKSLRIASSRGARSLLRVCVESAQQCLSILEALRTHGLLESFLPFDRDALFTSTIVLSVTAVVDVSLLRNRDSRLEAALAIFDEMINRGSRIADFQKHEIQQLTENLNLMMKASEQRKDFEPSSAVTSTNSQPSSSISHNSFPQNDFSEDMDNVDTVLSEWNSEDGLTGDHLLAVADSLDFAQLNWLTMSEFERSFPEDH